MAHVDDQRVARVLDALEAQHPGAQLLVNDPWSIYYLTGFYADMFERFCGVLLACNAEPVILVNALHQLPEYDNARVAYHADTDVVADAIAREELSKAGLDRDIWQCPVVLLADVHSVGVQGDERTYGSPIVLRPVSSEDAMTADWSRIPYDVLATISTRITNECRQINRVVLDCTSKPPATIEWE